MWGGPIEAALEARLPGKVDHREADDHRQDPLPGDPGQRHHQPSRTSRTPPTFLPTRPAGAAADRSPGAARAAVLEVIGGPVHHDQRPPARCCRPRAPPRCRRPATGPPFASSLETRREDRDGLGHRPVTVALRRDAASLPPSTIDIQIVERITDVDAADWDRLAGDDDPFLEHAFLAALEASGSVGARAGCVPRLVVARDGGRGWWAPCRSTSRPTATASSSSTGAGPTPRTAPGSATTRSWSRRSRSRPSPASGCP